MSAYLISQVEVLDAEAWENYRTRAAQVTASFGGRYLVRGARAEVIEADWPVEEPAPQIVIVTEFPSMRALNDWYTSPQYAKAFAFRAAAVRRRLIFVAGVDEPGDETDRARRSTADAPCELFQSVWLAGAVSGAYLRSRSVASLVRSTRDLTSSFANTWRRCVFTVCGDTKSRSAISRLVRPVATS